MVRPRRERKGSRLWSEKGRIDLIADVTERGSVRMLGFLLADRLLRILRPQDAAKPACDATPGAPAPSVMPVAGPKEILPRLIFQTWKVRHPLPPNYHVWSASFAVHNPGFVRVLWDDRDNRDFIARDFPWFLPIYDRYPQEIFRADIVRLFFLYRFGGLYADMDTECLAPLDPVLASGDVILGAMGRDAAFPHAIPNAIMASKPRQLFWLLAIAHAVERAKAAGRPINFVRGGPEFFTGSVLIRDTLERYRTLADRELRARLESILPDAVSVADGAAGTVTILPTGTWFPINWNNLWHRRFRRQILARQSLLTPAQIRFLFPEALLVTYWTHSW